ncbi:MAG TPA: tellurite resistance/C4-dicarboxylate transporter family protein [Solirubrobacterales bacterium]|nr:tellurite resistance/C4-dicarboxylate transporter family protein [Solirubrobacterales bacterium]
MPDRRASPGALDLLLGSVPPASGAVVMGTGIVSIGLSLDGQEALSRVLLVLDGATWLTLAVLLPARAVRDRERFRGDIRTPAAFTAVAGTAVLGTRLALLGWDWAGVVLLVVALAVWLGLIGPVLRHWRTPTVGASFILTVGTESLGLLAATLAHGYRAEWLLDAALVPFLLGLCFYPWVLCRFDFGQLAVGEGDHWVTGGALAISTVVAGRIVLAYQAVEPGGGALGALRGVSLALWVVALAWLPVLLVAELRRPRLRYGVRRWSTVFPVGMYAACSFVVGTALPAAAITRFAEVWIWVAVAVWAVVATGLLRAVVRETGRAVRHGT